MKLIDNILLKIRKRKAINIARDVKKQNLTYLSEMKLVNIVDKILMCEFNSIPGVIIEAGCALGGSSILIASIKNKNRLMKVYDVFGMIPPPSEKDGKDVHERYKVIENGDSKGIEGDEYYGYISDLYERVVNNFEKNNINISDNNVQLIKGLVQDTLFVESDVSLAHIDVDWYEPVMTCLERIEPKLSVGGSIILDDYHDWSGCKEATDEYFAEKKHLFSFDSSSGALVITRKL